MSTKPLRCICARHQCDVAQVSRRVQSPFTHESKIGWSAATPGRKQTRADKSGSNISLSTYQETTVFSLNRLLRPTPLHFLTSNTMVSCTISVSEAGTFQCVVNFSGLGRFRHNKIILPFEETLEQTKSKGIPAAFTPVTMLTG